VGTFVFFEALPFSVIISPNFVPNFTLALQISGRVLEHMLNAWQEDNKNY
jgi:hypothetical protein